MKITMDEPEKVVEKAERIEEREAIKKSFAGERKKLSSMKFKEKVDYIWSYYKAPIIGVILVGTLLGYFTYSLVTRKETTLTGLFVNVSSNNAEGFSVGLGEYMGLDDKHQVSVIDAVNLNSGSAYSTKNYSGAAQVLTVVASKELDFAMADKKGLEYLYENEILKDLSQLMPADIYAGFTDRLYTVNDKVIAIDLSGSKFQEAMNFSDLIELKEKSLYFCVQNLSGHEEELQLLFKYLYEFEFGDVPMEIPAM